MSHLDKGMSHGDTLPDTEIAQRWSRLWPISRSHAARWMRQVEWAGVLVYVVARATGLRAATTRSHAPKRRSESLAHETTGVVPSAS
jgi:hypothetical protein